MIYSLLMVIIVYTYIQFLFMQFLILQKSEETKLLFDVFSNTIATHIIRTD